MKVEFGLGGPVDGHVQEMPEGTSLFEVYTPAYAPGKWSTSPPVSGVPVETHIYRSTGRLSKAGHRLFIYAGKRRQ